MLWAASYVGRSFSDSSGATYYVLSEIAKGGSGVVYKAQRKNKSGDVEIVALKFVRKTRFAEIESGYTLSRRLWSDDHSGYFAKNESPFEIKSAPFLDAQTVVIPMEYIPESLSDALPTMGIWNVEERDLETRLTKIELLIEHLSIIMTKLADNNLAHSDIKPANILLKQDSPEKSRFMLSDFDTLAVMGKRVDTATDAYAPPEVLVHDQSMATLERDYYSSSMTVFRAILGSEEDTPTSAAGQGYFEDKLSVATELLNKLARALDRRHPELRARFSKVRYFIDAGLQENPRMRRIVLNSSLPKHPLVALFGRDPAHISMYVPACQYIADKTHASSRR
jgi:serine/threonine protein kinase